jgi:hypothetical protein
MDMSNTITSKQDGHFTVYEFTAAKYEFSVLHSGRTGMWTVYRAPKGLQRNLAGKTFWRTDEMIAAYKTAAAELKMIAATETAGVA